MKPSTEKLARRLASETVLENFLLVGGTALSIYLQHRLSEDLDFATADQSLPKDQIAALMQDLQQSGSEIIDILPLAARHEAINDGYDIEDFQQDWLVDGVKLTFFALPEDNGRQKLLEDSGKKWDGFLRLASMDTLFVTKALVLADRHAIRDNFDIKTFLENQLFTYDDLINAYKNYRPGTSLDIPRKRLLNADYPLTDPGLMGLVETDEASIVKEMQHYFQLLFSRKFTKLYLGDQT